jgi:hypothetical protein
MVHFTLPGPQPVVCSLRNRPKLCLSLLAPCHPASAALHQRHAGASDLAVISWACGAFAVRTARESVGFGACSQGRGVVAHRLFRSVCSKSFIGMLKIASLFAACGPDEGPQTINGRNHNAREYQSCSSAHRMGWDHSFVNSSHGKAQRAKALARRDGEGNPLFANGVLRSAGVGKPQCTDASRGQ